jgi:hypothetical protein
MTTPLNTPFGLPEQRFPKFMTIVFPDAPVGATPENSVKGQLLPPEAAVKLN